MTQGSDERKARRHGRSVAPRLRWLGLGVRAGAANEIVNHRKGDLGAPAPAATAGPEAVRVPV